DALDPRGGVDVRLQPQAVALEAVRNLGLAFRAAVGDRLLPRAQLALEGLGHTAVTAAGRDERGERGVELRVARDEGRAQSLPACIDRVAIVVENGLPGHDERDGSTDDDDDEGEQDPTKTTTHRPATLPAHHRTIAHPRC